MLQNVYTWAGSALQTALGLITLALRNHLHFATTLVMRPLPTPIWAAAEAMARACWQLPLLAAASAARVARPATMVLQSCCPLGSLQLRRALAAAGKFPLRAAERHASQDPPPPPLAGAEPVVDVVDAALPVVVVFGGSAGLGEVVEACWVGFAVV